MKTSPLALKELENETSLYAILESNTGEFIQTTGNKKDGYSVEYQEGSIEKHYLLGGSFTLEQVTSYLPAICEW